MTDLHLLAATSWPAPEQVEVEGWLLRAAAGVTLRANSALPLVALPLATSTAPLDDLLAAVEDFYDARLLTPTVQVADPALDAALADRGWTAHFPTDVLVGPLPDAPGDAVVGELDDAWLDCWWAVDGRGGDPERAVAVTVLEGVRSPAGYARVVRDGVVVACARGVAHGPWLGVSAVAVRPEHRRRGLARAVLSALWRWGDAQGTTTAYLQVGRDDPGRALYVGMQPAGSYRYRRRP